MLNFPPNKKIILFDGVCNLCHSAVRFIIKRDTKDVFRFVSLESELGKEILRNIEIAPANSDSIMLYESEVGWCYKSLAVIKIAESLGGFLSLATVFRIIPTGIGNQWYDWIAKNRYRWFGKNENCLVPANNLEYKFL